VAVQHSTTDNRYEAFLSRWLHEHPTWAYEGDGRRRDAQDIANDLLRDTGLAEIKLANVLTSPSAVSIRAIVERSLPWPQSAEIELLVRAVTLAALASQRNDRKQLFGYSVIAVVIAGSLLYWTHGMSGQRPKRGARRKVRRRNG
jgi:hypothetical protein